MATCHSIGLVDSETGLPDTTKIDRRMVPKLASISKAKQRILIDLLFFWEQELVRWRLLCQEESQLREQLSDTGLDEGTRTYFRHHLQVVQAAKRVLPSMRHEDGQIIAQEEEQLPSYEASGRRATVA